MYVVVGFRDWVEWGVYLSGILLQPFFVQLAANPNRNCSHWGWVRAGDRHGCHLTGNQMDCGGFHPLKKPHKKKFRARAIAQW